ncbi:MAG: monovalent cation:proton antiporter-2 (CPA2) family protein [Bacteroidetes bacterium]|nr:monovalent cation:proton antiporter-2 (CPA2) family protein [Bacteroidota bacterium]
MHQQDFFFQALIYLSAAVISVPLAKRLGLGSVLGYLLAGIIIGPYVLKLVGAEGTDVMHFAEFGVVMMLFLIGLELKPALLWKMRRAIFGLGGLQVTITALLVGGVSMIMGLNLFQSITVGLIMALSSTAIVIQSLSEKGLLKSEGGQGAFSVLLFQDIAVIPILAILPLMANQVELGNLTAAVHDAGKRVTGVSALPGWQQVMIIVGVVSVIIFMGRFFARYMFRFIASAGLREIFTAAALLLVIGIAVAMDQVGLSPALGTFLAGVVLADNEYRHELESDIEPFKGLLLGLFFIAVGASIDFQILWDNPGMILGLLGILVLIKFGVLYGLSRVFGLRSGQEMLFSLSLAQAGEFAFVLISFSSQNAILDQGISGLLLIVVALSMLITPLLLILYDQLVQPFFSKRTNEKPSDAIDDNENSVIIAGFGRFGLVIGRFLKANGISATILDNNPSNIQVLRKFGFKVYYGDASRPDLLQKAGAENASVLIIAIDDKDRITQMTEHAKRTYPHLKIIARAIDVPHSFTLEDLQVDAYRRETYDSSLDLGIKALCTIGFQKYQAHRMARMFRYHDNLIMKELHQLRGKDEKHYFNEVRRFSEQLENILSSEQHQSLNDNDSAWDASTLREEIRQMYSEMSEEK